VLLRCLTSILHLSDLGGPNRSIKTQASIAIRVTEVCNPPPRKGDSTQGVEVVIQTRKTAYLIFDLS